MGMLSRMGGRLGVAQQIQARGPLGFFGNFVPVAYVNIFAGIGWAAVTVILGGQALHALVPAIPFWLGALVLVALQLVVAVYGYNMIHYLERILAVVLFFGFLMITVVSVCRGWQGGFGTNPNAAVLGRRRGRLDHLRGLLPVLPHRLVALRLRLLPLPARRGPRQPGHRLLDLRRQLHLPVLAGHRRRPARQLRRHAARAPSRHWTGSPARSPSPRCWPS